MNQHNPTAFAAIPILKMRTQRLKQCKESAQCSRPRECALGAVISPRLTLLIKSVGYYVPCLTWHLCFGGCWPMIHSEKRHQASPCGVSLLLLAQTSCLLFFYPLSLFPGKLFKTGRATLVLGLILAPSPRKPSWRITGLFPLHSPPCLPPAGCPWLCVHMRQPFSAQLW